MWKGPKRGFYLKATCYCHFVSFIKGIWMLLPGSMASSKTYMMLVWEADFHSIASFFTVRKFQVRIGRNYSKVSEQEMGVPLVSILSVILFCLKILNSQSCLPWCRMLSVSLIRARLDTLESRREHLTERFFKRNVLTESSCVHYLLPDKRETSITDKLRHPKTFKPLPVRTVKFRYD